MESARDVMLGNTYSKILPANQSLFLNASLLISVEDALHAKKASWYLEVLVFQMYLSLTVIKNSAMAHALDAPLDIYQIILVDAHREVHQLRLSLL